MIPDQPGASRPDEARLIRVLGEEVRARLDCLWNEPVVILFADLFRVIGEADVEMRLEDQMDALFCHFHFNQPINFNQPTVPRTTSRVPSVSVNGPSSGFLRRRSMRRTRARTRSSRSIRTVVRL